MKSESVKQWNHTPCGSKEVSEELEKGSLEFFDAVRKSRYEITDDWMLRKIPFVEGKDKKVLEIGFGMGTDLLNWRRNGAEVYGIDITQEHYRLAQLNFKTHNEEAHLQLADAAAIPFEDKHLTLSIQMAFCITPQTRFGVFQKHIGC